MDELDGRLRSSVHDPSAFVNFVDDVGPQVQAYLIRRAPLAAEDLLSHVWLQAWSSRRTYDPALGSARAWIFGVARNVLHRHWRGLAAGAGPIDFERPIDPWDEVERRLDSAALAAPLRAALDDLPAVDREMLLLIAWEDLSPTEAAAAVGIPAGTARSRLHRARARMRSALTLDPDFDTTAPSGGTL